MPEGITITTDEAGQSVTIEAPVMTSGAVGSYTPPPVTIRKEFVFPANEYGPEIRVFKEEKLP